MQQLKIFSEEGYVIDTSSLVDVRLEADPTKVWAGIFRLIDQGKLLTVGYVFPELERMVATDKVPEEIFEKLKERKTRVVIPDAQIIGETGKINFKYPKLGNWRDPKNRADPWIVAAAKTFGHTVVTEERDTGPEKTHRIPWACDQEGVKWIRVSRLVVIEKL